VVTVPDNTFNIKKCYGLLTQLGFVFCIEIAAIVCYTALTHDRYMLMFTIKTRFFLILFDLATGFGPECVSSSGNYIRTLKYTETVCSMRLGACTITVTMPYK